MENGKPVVAGAGSPRQRPQHRKHTMKPIIAERNRGLSTLLTVDAPQPGAPRRMASLRIPPRAEKRAYLRALRAAEEQAWEDARPAQPPRFSRDRLSPCATTSASKRIQNLRAEGHPAPRPERLPRSAAGDRAEEAGQGLLALAAAGAIGMALWTSGSLAQHWDRCVDFIQRLVATM